MIDVYGSRAPNFRKLVLAIAVRGLIAGTLDHMQAFALFGTRVPRLVAAGLLGRQALHGGASIYALGVLLHFSIALSAAAIYYAASRELNFLTGHWLVCGLFYGSDAAPTEQEAVRKLNLNCTTGLAAKCIAPVGCL